MIIFPAEGVFAERGVASMGVPMFFLSYVDPLLHFHDRTSTQSAQRRTLIGQLVYTLGGSQFAGANASIMIEVVVRPSPFPHAKFTMSLSIRTLASHSSTS
jgi:SulP family sulfate permease